MSNLTGTGISHYRIIDLLKKGGMGEVYVAYDEKLDRQVAVKTIRADHKLNAEAKARFLREARILSQLAHPNICQIFDYIEEDAADFIVLELIPGQRLTESMRTGHDHKQKLKIAAQIAGVLVAAHEKGIIHRDLKPDNIMLSVDGQVKVLDFGLSRSQQNETALKLTAHESDASPTTGNVALATDHTQPIAFGEATAPHESIPASNTDNLTRIGMIMGTLEYMSPEQARGDAVTTASDLYSFGLILQELFTGKPAYATNADTLAWLEKIKNGETLPAEGIDTDLAALIKRLKSLAPAVRSTAADAAERLAWIQRKPARRRNKILLAAAIAVLTLFSVAMTIQTIRATRAEKRAKEEAAVSQRVSEFLVSIFNVSDPSEAKGNTITAREILDNGAAKIESELKDQPLMQARLMDTMGNVYRSLGLYKKSQPLLEKSLKIREKELGANHIATAMSLNFVARVCWNQGNYTAAEPLYKRALAIRETLFGPDHAEIAESLDNLANLYRDQGKFDQAEPLFKRAVAIREKVLQPYDHAKAGGLNNLADFYTEQGKYVEAELFQKRALAIVEKISGADHIETAINLNNLASLYQKLCRYAEAEPLFKRSLAIREKILGAEHPGTATGINNLANLYVDQGQYALAEPLCKRALAIVEKALGPEHPHIADTLSILAGVYRQQGKYAEAELVYKRALAIDEKISGPNHPNTAYSLNNIALLYHKQGKYTEAEPLFKRSLAILEKTFGPSHPATAASLHNLAKLYRETNRFSEAEPLFKNALEIREIVLGKNHPKTTETLTEYAKLLRQMKRVAEAAQLEARAKAILETPKLVK